MQKKTKKTPVSQDIYDNEYYKSGNPGYEQFKDGFKLRDGYKERFDRIEFKGKNVLDIGCGRGEFVYYSASRGAKAVGIDYSKAAVKILKSEVVPVLNREFGDKARVLAMDAKELKFPDEIFDIVTMFDVVEHLHDWELKQCVEGVYRVLKPGGKVFVHTSPNKYMMDLVRVAIKPFGTKLKSEPYHVNEQTYFSLKKYFNKFNGKIELEKDKNYWSNQMGARSEKLKKLAKIIDFVIDFPGIHHVLKTLPFSLLFGSYIWFLGFKGKGNIKFF